MMGAAELQASHDGTTRAASWWRAWWPEIAIVALAALVRFWRLDYHSFWFDEAVSLDWAEDNPAFIWANTFPLLNDKHPPAYYLLLHYWQKGLALFGLEHSDVALRSLGAILGVLTVLGVLLLARRLSGRATARCVEPRARLVQPGTAHVPAGDDGRGLGGLLPGARLAGRDHCAAPGLVDRVDRGLYLCAL